MINFLLMLFFLLILGLYGRQHQSCSFRFSYFSKLLPPLIILCDQGCWPLCLLRITWNYDRYLAVASPYYYWSTNSPSALAYTTSIWETPSTWVGAVKEDHMRSGDSQNNSTIHNRMRISNKLSFTVEATMVLAVLFDPLSTRRDFPLRLSWIRHAIERLQCFLQQLPCY